jgi:hypothetical protein
MVHTHTRIYTYIYTHTYTHTHTHTLTRTGAKGVKRDVTRAVRFLEAAARSGDVKAHVNLGRAYQHGIGVARDEGMAVSHFEKAHTGTLEHHQPYSSIPSPSLFNIIIVTF